MVDVFAVEKYVYEPVVVIVCKGDAGVALAFHAAGVFKSDAGVAEDFSEVFNGLLFDSQAG